MRVTGTRSKSAYWLLFGLVVLGVLSMMALWITPIYQGLSESYHAEIRFKAVETRSHPAPDEDQVLRNLIGAQLSPTPHIFIDVKFRHFEKLREKRDAALEQNALFTAADDLVPAKIRHLGETTKVRIRLKGDFTDHLLTDKWSLRVEVRGDKQLFGMRRFSLQAPSTKNYHHEALYLDHARREGILAVRYFFVDVTLNGEHLGLMALEEHFSKELLEAQHRREGIIVKYDEDDFWHSFHRADRLNRQHGGGATRVLDNWKVAWIKAFRSKRVQASELFRAHQDAAVGLLRGLAQETLTPAEVFDVDATGKFLALTDLWGSWHALRWHNVRFYVNPLTLKLEPIAFDADVAQNWRRKAFVHRESWFYYFVMADPWIQRAYDQHMTRFTSEPYLAGLEDFLEERESEYLLTLHKEYPSLPKFDFETIAIKRDAYRSGREPDFFRLREAKSLKRVRDRNDARDTPIVYGYLTQEEGASFLELTNPMHVDAIVDSLSVRKGEQTLALTKVGHMSLPIRLGRSFYGMPQAERTPPPQVLRIRLPPSLVDSEFVFTGTAHLSGDEHSYRFEVRPYAPALDAPPVARRAALSAILADHDYLRWERGRFFVIPGKWTVRKPLVIPQVVEVRPEANGVPPLIAGRPGLKIGPGTTLLFEENSYLRTAGTLVMLGSKEAPIELRAARTHWKGVAVLDSPEASAWSHVTVRDTTFTADGAWRLTGGVTFYQSDITITDCHFVGTTAEDALNIVRSKFNIATTTFSETSSDAFDSDFSTGQLDDLSFQRIGGDGVDVSGSVLELKRLRFAQIHDKAISVGEASQVTGEDVAIDESGVGIVTKDGSSTAISDVRGTRMQQALLMSYIKKPEYGRSQMAVSRVSFDNSAQLAIAQKGNDILIDGKRVFTQTLDVQALYQTEGAKRW